MINGRYIYFFFFALVGRRSEFTLSNFTTLLPENVSNAINVIF